MTPQNWVGAYARSAEAGTMCNRNGREVSQSGPCPGYLSLGRGQGLVFNNLPQNP